MVFPFLGQHGCGQQLLALLNVRHSADVLIPKFEDDAMTLVLTAQRDVRPRPVRAGESGLLYIQLQLYKYWFIITWHESVEIQMLHVDDTRLPSATVARASSTGIPVYRIPGYRR